MTSVPVKRAASLASVVLLLLAAGCVNDDEITDPRDASFVGYSNPDTKQTTCGNCHITKQRTWVQTGHARAWEGLQSSSHAQASCEKCHTTGGNGNAAPLEAGFASVTGNARRFYHDVQCESCHGPGSGHISAPDDAQPLTVIAADSASKVGCGGCHQGSHHPFTSEWQVSRHGILNAYPAGRPVADGCPSCHEGRQATVRWDAEAKFTEQRGTQPLAIVCSVCHDPHGSPNGAMLRRPINTPDREQNLCMQCHDRRSAPAPGPRLTPHSAQGPMLIGEAGWIPPNFAYDATRAATSHGASANPRYCAGCHVESFRVTDKATGSFIMNSTGHRFLAMPCVDANGQPTGRHDCAETERRMNACVGSGCHASATAARSARSVTRGRLQALADVLWRDLNGNNSVDAAPTDGGLLATVRAHSTAGPECLGTGAFANTITVCKGVFFNTYMVTREGSYGVHNPFYSEALLLGSTTALRAQYTFLPAPSAAEQAMMTSRMRELGMPVR